MSNDAKDILVLRNDQQIGPFSEDQIHESLSQNLLSPKDLAWRPGLPEWKPLGLLLNLTDFVPAPPPSTLPSQAAGPDGTRKSKVAFILLGIFLGSLGIHNYYAGYSRTATIQLLVTLLTCSFAALPIWIWAIVEVITVKVDANGVPFGD